MSDTITVPAFTDAHVHLRQGSMTRAVALYTARVCDNVVAMPNTTPPIHSQETIVLMRGAYREALEANDDPVRLFMTAKLMPTTTPQDVLEAAALGIVGFKLYPCGVTTNSNDGIPWDDLCCLDRWPSLLATIREIERVGMALLCHGESDGYVMSREHEFMWTVPTMIKRLFPRLHLTLEHLTTEYGVNLVRDLERRYPGTVLGTITLHHMETTLNDVIGGMLKPDLFCKPIPKSTEDMLALRMAAFSGEPYFALGSDSAPHAMDAKYGACGCAGVFTAPVLAEGIVSLFAQREAAITPKSLARLEQFTSANANRFYNFPPSTRKLVFQKESWVVPPSIGATSYRVGESLAWQLKKVIPCSIPESNPVGTSSSMMGG